LKGSHATSRPDLSGRGKVGAVRIVSRVLLMGGVWKEERLKRGGGEEFAMVLDYHAVGGRGGSGKAILAREW